MAFVSSKAGVGRSVRWVAIIATLVVTLGTGLAGAQNPHDVKLDQAIDSLTLAQNLLMAADFAGTPEQERKFDRHVDRALKLIQQAIEQILAAAEVPLAR